MPLQKQLVPQPFSGGIDTKSNAKMVRHPSLLTMDNAILTSAGEIRKRAGHTAPYVPRSNTEGLISTSNGEPLNVADGLSYAKTPQGWTELGQCAGVKITAAHVSSSLANTITFIDGDTTASGYRVTAWYDQTAGAVKFSVEHLATKVITHSGVDLISGYSDKLAVVAVENTVFIVLAENGTIYQIPEALFGTNFEVAALSILSYNHDTGYKSSWVAWDSDTTAVQQGWCLLGVATKNGSDLVRFSLFSQDGTQLGVNENFLLTSVNTGSNADTTYPIVYFPPTSSYTAGFSGVLFSYAQYYASYLVDGTLGWLVDATTLIRTITSWPSSATVAPTEFKFWKTRSLVEYASSVATESSRIHSFYVGGPSFPLGSRTYLLATEVDMGADQPQVYLIDAETQNVAGNFLYSMAHSLDVASYPIYPKSSHGFEALSTPVSSATGETWFYAYTSAAVSVPYDARLDYAQRRTYDTRLSFSDAPCTVTIDTDVVNRYPHVNAIGYTVVGGGVTSLYDGTRQDEFDFLLYPYVSSVSENGAGAMGAGTYSYKAIFEWVDAKGNVRRSAASPAYSVTIAASKKVDLVIYQYLLGNRDLDGIRVAIYRTQAGGTTVYYRTTTVEGTAFNDPTQSSVTYTDNVTDATLATREVLYTVGGELDNDPPPSFRVVTSAKNRLWGVDEWGILWFSKEFRLKETPGFSFFLQKSIPESGGDIVALAQLDDNLLVFREERTYVFNGPGPDPTGNNDLFSEVGELAAVTGTLDPMSVCTVPDGILYKTNKGFFFIDRGLNVTEIGRGVHGYLSSTVTSAHSHPTEKWVYFQLDSGETLVFNYDVRDASGAGVWSTYSNLGSKRVVSGGECYLLMDNQQVWVEDPAVFTDDGEYITTTVETGWFAPTGPQGWKRLYRVFLLGEKKSEHILNVGLAYNYLSEDQGLVQFDTTDLADTSYGAGVFGSGSYGNSDEGDLYQFRINPAKQECSAVKIRIWDTGHAGTGESFTLTDLTFEVGMKSLGGTGTKLSNGRSG